MTSSGAAPSHAPRSFASLPDDLALRILDSVPLTERHTSCCLVSKHWHALVHSPQLLRSLDIKLPEDDSQPLRRLRALAPWVQQHASPGQLRTLQLGGLLPIAHNGFTQGAEEAEALTGGMLARCTGLTSLHLAVHWDVRVGSWLAAMPHLRQLRIRAWSAIDVTVPQQQMPPLTELRLQSDEIRFEPWAGLPTSVAKLSLRGMMQDGLPAEMDTLTRLRLLHLASVFSGADGEALPFLPRLSRLEQLHLRGCYPLPQCVSQLTQLRALSLADDFGMYWGDALLAGGEHTGAVALAALAELTRLTFLALSEMPGMTSLPSCVSALTGLRTLLWDGGTNADGQFIDPASAALPHGAWLDGLHTLCTYPIVLLGTIPLLGTAAQLQCAGVVNWHGISQDDMVAAVRCAAGHAGLHRLLVEVDAAELPKLCSQAAGEGRQLPPGLRVESQPEQHICNVLIEECGASICEHM